MNDLQLNTIYNEDCLETMKRMPDNFVDLVVTSPPYNRGHWNQNNKTREADAWSGSRKLAYGEYNDNLEPKDYESWQKTVISELLRVLKPTGSIFYNHKALPYKGTVIYPLWVFEFKVRQQIIWDRGSTPVIYPDRFYPTTEYLFWITKGAPKFYRRKAGFQHEVWRIPPRSSEHPAPFPIELAKNCIVSTTEDTDLIYDPFMGSGTTARACKDLGRNYIGSEISPEYCKIAEQRLRQEVLV